MSKDTDFEIIRSLDEKDIANGASIFDLYDRHMREAARFRTSADRVLTDPDAIKMYRRIAARERRAALALFSQKPSIG